MRISAFPDEGRWLRGNLHAHTTLSDGLVPPEQQAADYRAMGYDFLSVTDHNVMHKLQELGAKLGIKVLYAQNFKSAPISKGVCMGEPTMNPTPTV